jgi:hypothetical protein
VSLARTEQHDRCFGAGLLFSNGGIGIWRKYERSQRSDPRNRIGSNSIERAQRKMYSILEAQRRGFPNVKDDNIADALGLLSLRCSMLGLTPPWDYKRSPGPLFTGVAAPAGVKITKANKIAANVAVNKLLSFEREKPS